MGKKQCKNDDYKEKDEALYICRKCERKAKKEEKLCKPMKIKDRFIDYHLSINLES